MQTKTVLITGASRGIGASCAKRFAKAGFSVIVHYNKNEGMAQNICDEVIKKGGKAIALQADLANPAEIEELAKKATEWNGGVDVLVNNAGLAMYKMLCDTTTHDLDTLFAVNIRSMMLLSKALLPHMIHRKEGRIINLSSIWGITGASCEVAYSATKAAVIGFTKALAKELGPSGILVNCVAPGVIDTDMNAILDDETKAALCEETPLGRMGSPEEIAETVFYLASDASRYITGQVISPNGGMIC